MSYPKAQMSSGEPKPSRRRALALACACAITAVAETALAESIYPDKSVSLVLPFSAAGAADIGARLLAQGLSDKLGQQFIIENRPGAAGNIAYSSIARAEPSGYEVLIGYVANSACAHAMMDGLSWKAESFEPVAIFSATPLIFVAHKSLPVNSMPELIAYLKEHPGEVNYGTWGVGSFAHIVTEAAMQSNETEMVAIPYSNTGDLLTDAMAGTIQIFATGPATVLAQKDSESFKLLGVTGTERVPDLPDLPTLIEQGLSDVNMQSWYGLLVPKGTPPEVIATLDQAVIELASDEAFVTRAAASGIPILHVGAAEFEQQIVKDTELCTDVIKSAGIKID